MATLTFPRPRARGPQIAAALIVGAGHVIGFAGRCLPFLSAYGGVALVSAGTGEISGHIFGHGLAPWVTALVLGLFLLYIDRHSGPQPPGRG